MLCPRRLGDSVAEVRFMTVGSVAAVSGSLLGMGFCSSYHTCPWPPEEALALIVWT